MTVFWALVGLVVAIFIGPLWTIAALTAVVVLVLLGREGRL